MGNGFMKALKTHLDLTEWERYYDNPKYIKDTIHYNYWYSQDNGGDEQESFGLKVLIIVSVITVVISAIALFILFKCKVGEKSEDDSKESGELMEP